MKINQPINLKQWIAEHRDLLKPPVGNQVIWTDSNFMVMVVAGPNARNDFHVNETEELFYQVEGDIQLHIHDGSKIKILTIKEGDIFLLPAKIPHCPVRGPNTIGVVVETKREANVKDGFIWYCQQCNAELYSEYVHISDIVKQLPNIFDDYQQSLSHRTCQKCGFVNPAISQ